MINNCFQKTKKSFLKRLWKGTKTFLKKKTQGTNLLMGDIEIFQKKKKKTSDSMADTKNF